MFLFIAKKYSKCRDVSHLCIQQLVDIWTLNFLNNSNFNVEVQDFIEIYSVISLGYILSNGITASHGNFMSIILGNCQTVLQNI